ncbi:MAG: 1-(5-phosphoribosyl)-5-[(5-phosphoribosylamino)methylideneamino]imidazole-4-carboxamide isomerase [Eubacteriaceae bacterium]|jgi:phosphoribosylformimino-5-aminoimidazole carboxamide ribotide isomerase
MIVLPAIDLKGGKCVRLIQGKKNDETVYSDNPVEMAKRFEKQGAEYLHIIDLDGAFEGSPQNLPVIEEIAKTVNIPIEVGGGIRDLDTAKRYIDAGVSRIIIGTKAVEDLDFIETLISRYDEKVAVSLDAKDSIVCTRGWTESSDIEVLEMASRLEAMGLSTLVYTDISKDGMLTGPNMKMLEILHRGLKNMNVIASGGVASEQNLRDLENMGLYGAITGKAVYEGKIDLEGYLKEQKENRDAR